MAEPVEAYLIAIGTMLFAGLVALTLTTVVKHLDPPEHAAATARPRTQADRSRIPFLRLASLLRVCYLTF